MTTPLIQRLAIGLIVAAGSGVTAAAAPVLFTWNPSGVPALAGGGPAFTADGITASDYVYVHQAGTNNVPYTGTMVSAVTGFTLGGAPVSVPGLGSSYGLYFLENENAVLLNGVATTLGGTIQLIADPTHNDGSLSTTLANQIAFSNPPGTADDIILASGPILSGTFRAPLGGPVSKFLVSEFDVAAGASGFFLSPVGNHVQLELLNTNTATSRQFLLQPDGSGITLVNGAIGSIDIAVPEPASLALLAAGLLGLAALRRRVERR